MSGQSGPASSFSGLAKLLCHEAALNPKLMSDDIAEETALPFARSLPPEP